MKKLFLTTLLACAFLAAITQKVTITLSPVVEISTSQNIFKTESGYLSYSVSKQKERMLNIFSSFSFSDRHFDITLTKYDELLKVLKETDLSTSLNACAFEPTVEQLNGKLYLVFYESSEKEIVLKAAEINPETVSLNSSKVLFKIQVENKMGTSKQVGIEENRKLRIQISPDRSKVLFLFENGIDNSFSYCVTDKDINVLWSKANLIDSREDIVITSACVDNVGTVYIGYKIESKKNGIRGFVFISDQLQKEKDIAISKDVEIYQILVIPSKIENFINVVGTCFDGTQYIGSVFSATISIAERKLENFKKINLDEKFIDLFDQDGLAHTKTNKYGIYPSKMSVYELENGSIGMIGEIRKINTSSETHQNISGRLSGSSYRTLISGCILNVCFKKDSFIFSRIPKLRETDRIMAANTSGFLPDTHVNEFRSLEQSPGGGFYFSPYKNDILVFYNDAERNLNRNISEMPSASNNIKDLVLVKASISNDGTITRDIIIDLKDDDFIAFPANIKTVSPNSFLIPIRQVSKNDTKNNFRLGKMEIK